jgi:hypothetical protein
MLENDLQLVSGGSAYDEYVEDMFQRRDVPSLYSLIPRN